MTSRKVLANHLTRELLILDRCKSNLNYSYKRVADISLNTEPSSQELEILDSFCSRFMRCYEVLINQVMRTTLRIVNEYGQTFFDNINTADKLRLITNVDDIEEIRKLRNMVAHDYLIEEWLDIYKSLKIYSPILIESCDLCQGYISKKGLAD